MAYGQGVLKQTVAALLCPLHRVPHPVCLLAFCFQYAHAVSRLWEAFYTHGPRPRQKSSPLSLWLLGRAVCLVLPEPYPCTSSAEGISRESPAEEASCAASCQHMLWEHLLRALRKGHSGLPGPRASGINTGADWPPHCYTRDSRPWRAAI